MQPEAGSELEGHQPGPICHMIKIARPRITIQPPKQTRTPAGSCSSPPSSISGKAYPGVRFWGRPLAALAA
jgi:hypothetical protein